MAQFIDYYAEFEIERTADCNAIRNKLGNLEAGYLQQRAVCLTSTEMEVVQKLLDLIDEAIYNLANEERRKKYDKKLEKMAKSGELNNQQTSAMNDYEQAVYFESKGKAKEAIVFVERAIAKNIYNKDAYALMIRCCFQIGQYQKAIEVAESKAIKIYPDELSFYQYAARIHTINKNYDNSKKYIDNMLKLNEDNPAGHIEKAVRLLYISEDKNLSDLEREQARKDAKVLIDQQIENQCDDLYRNGIATALIGLSERHYSEFEGVPCKIINSQEAYLAIRELHEWAGKVSSDENIQNAVKDIRNQGEKKYNSDNHQAILCLSSFAIIFILGALMVLSEMAKGTKFTDLGESSFSFVIILVFVIIPWILLIKVSFRPMWMLDRIRYTGHVDLIERIMVGYGKFFLSAARIGKAMVSAIIKLAISLASRAF